MNELNNKDVLAELRKRIFKAAEVTYTPFSLNTSTPKEVIKMPLDELMAVIENYTSEQVQLGRIDELESLKMNTWSTDKCWGELNDRLDKLRQLKDTTTTEYNNRYPRTGTSIVKGDVDLDSDTTLLEGDNE